MRHDSSTRGSAGLLCMADLYFNKRVPTPFPSLGGESFMAETLYRNRIADWNRESPTAIGGDYLTEDQAAALRAFLERMANAPRKPVGPRNGPGDTNAAGRATEDWSRARYTGKLALAARQGPLARTARVCNLAGRAFDAPVRVLHRRLDDFVARQGGKLLGNLVGSRFVDDASMRVQ